MATVAPNQVPDVPVAANGVDAEMALLEEARLETWDIVVIIAYFVIVLGFGLWVRMLCFFMLCSTPI